MFTFAGLSIFTGTRKEVVSRVDSWIRAKKRVYICVTGAHGVTESSQRTDIMRAHNNAGLIVPDGMPLVWLGRLSGHPETERIYGPDLFLDLCMYAQQEKRRIFLYGTTQETLNKLILQLKITFPNLQIVGSYAPPFRTLSEPEKGKVTERINAAKPNIVFVGLSTPKQELWMHEFSGRLRPAVLIGIGAAFDFIAGTKKQAPVWLRQSGLEWVFRMVHDPKRLIVRYVFVMRQMFRLLCLRIYTAFRFR